MTTQTAPVIPPRPSRSPQQPGLAPKSISDIPKIPPRPGRLVDRSVSPLRDSYAPSPLNERPNAPGISRTVSNDLPQRPPSVAIPSLGEEGIEYQDLDIPNVSDSHSQIPAPSETRNVGSDLKIHAPRPSLPSSSAKAQVQAVTRLDSRQAAAAGLGMAGSPVVDDQVERSSRSMHSRASGSRADSSTASSDRRRSCQLAEEHGIPEIGQRVPMYPNAGDVQAPSPSPYQSEHGGQRQGRNHHRTRSGRREASLPPGSYGLHGHGVPQDKFEKAWYEKHPEEYAKEEHGQYGPGVGTPRPDWALSSDDLNKIVRTSAVTGCGLGTSPAVTGTPDEEVGYIASDEYTQRMVTPAPESRRSSRLVAESPLRSANTTAPEADKELDAHKSEGAGVIHVNDPYHQLHHPDGFAPTPALERQSREMRVGDEDEDEPILAADEIRPESAFQHPAVSPSFDRRTSDHDGRSRTPSINHSRSNSRSTGHHSAMPALVRYNSRDEREDTHTPLDDVEEYEPLFPEDGKDKKPVSTTDRFKRRPELSKHRFPSEDIWEDSPNSLQLHATVSTPDTTKNEAFETPEQESFRRSHTPHIDARGVATNILESEERGEKTARRPEVSKQRFPSRDIWEDVPESQKLVTTIEPSTENEVKSPDVPSKPAIPSRPAKRPQQSSAVDASLKPATSPTEKRQPPNIPDRPKPQIPVRPAKAIPRGVVDNSREAPAKEKPAVPVRPNGGKIAALKAGFLSDLNSRLQLGPQAPKPQEKKEEAAPAEKAPLSDARKGRARGPARRKPAAENVSSRLPTIPEIKITETWNVWQVGEDGNLTVETGVQANPSEPVSKDTVAPALSKNLAGESTDPSPVQEPAPKTTEAVEMISSRNGDSAAAPAAEPAHQESPQQPEAKEEVSSEMSSEIKPSTSPPVDKVIEVLAATADGKRLSEGSILEADQNAQ
ncbi:Aim21 family protein [Aspergillus clavatus NRRL 1]|uniref:Altered inheritance of mitochondria protein 21 n=1 Tax=Aspergillus clavatus (strain ATCC 1007 / CBS 513.65 / DSM 816 / NCTC 3887 / NRRL 1 / QM 1276 / 107) TaxID=344612 RepID=A1CKG5_ASPCL|nr:uncharacterized protein ACLA_038500 [Aspergillus clavatus NRRL 1]EAW09639.1 conserved hypothetical protein [Aspergillus clavatus NRRL 1]